MIISHKYNFIFIKTKKTAGTSIEIALSQFCGPTDIITPISFDDEEKRSLLGYRGPQNYLKPYSRYNLKDFARLLLYRKKAKLFFNHISAKKIKEIIGENVWNSYYKFCFERNPWDKSISLYFWETRDKQPQPKIKDYFKIGRIEMIHKSGGYGLYTINRNIVVDMVYKYEDINNAMIDLKTELNLPEVPQLPKTKSSYRLERKKGKNILGKNEIDKIASVFEREIQLFEYTYKNQKLK